LRPYDIKAKCIMLVSILVLALAACMVILPLEAAEAADLDWQEYGSNPIYDPVDHRTYYPCVLYEPNKFSGHGASYYYKMWYADYSSVGTYKEAVTYSDDGVNWTAPVEMQGMSANGYHAKILYIPEGYGAGPYYYKIWYWDSVMSYSINDLRTADSADGVNWVNDQILTQDGASPLVTGVSPDWNRGSYGPVAMLYNPSASNSGSDPFDYTFTMYYDGTTGGVEVIGLGYSADGNHWTRYGNNPVLDLGGGGEWDSNYVTNGSVIPGDDGIWRMWYSGGQTSAHQGIGYATSPDGISWSRDPGNPLYSVNDGVAWRDDRCYTPSVFYDADGFSGHGDVSLFKMWFTGQDQATSNRTIGYAFLKPSLVFEKSAVPSGTVQRGSVITYTLRTRNDGGGLATGCTITDSIPTYTSYVSHTTTLNGELVPDVGGTTPLETGMTVYSPGEPEGNVFPGEEAVVTFRVQVGNDLPIDGEVKNVATFEADGAAPEQVSSVNPSSGELPTTWYFAEGSTQPGFDEYILLTNLGDTDITAQLTYLTDRGSEQAFQHTVPANSRRTVVVNSEMPNETGVAVIVQGTEGLVCERSMYFERGGITGGHDVIGANAPSIDLFMAEGFTGSPGSPFEEWVLLLNPGLNQAHLQIDYLFPVSDTLRREYDVPPRSRISINVDQEVGEEQEVSVHIRSDNPVVAERSMYFVYNNIWPGGHCEKAVTGARSDWYLAEGFTGWSGSPFDEWILVSNGNDQENTVTVTYMYPDGSTHKVDHTTSPDSRLTISADADVGQDQEISAHIHADLPVVVERAMYFDYQTRWSGGHDTNGATAPAAEIYFAEGYTGNPSSQFETWLLIQNTSTQAETAVVEYILFGGESVFQEVGLPPQSRTTINANDVLGQEALEFSIRVNSKDGSPTLLAERAMYFDYSGSFGNCTGGHDVVGY
jgi:uncharacterized repeat protein (TIGR01451 family)